ncbi:dihydroxyacetone kinase subunit L, partial [Staphylococcus sp. AOAB]
MDINTTKQHLLELENTFKEQEDTLTELDRAIGDGDHGVNMLRGFENLKDKVDDSSMKNLFKSTGMTLMSNIGGASGPLYGFSFVKMAEVFSDDIDHDNLVTLLETFTEAIAKRGKVELNEKTMYDVVARTFEAVKADEKVNFCPLYQSPSPRDAPP